MRKGIILAGGAGTRLHPLTRVVSKQLLPVYDKPMIYYPLSTLMLAGIREVLVISTPQDLPNFERLLGDGSSLGMKFAYKVQEVPNGLAQAFVLGREFIGGDDACLVLGDNIFYGQGFTGMLKDAVVQTDEMNCATLFAYAVKDPNRFGVVSLDANGKATKLVEKPEHPESNFAVTGLYFYPNDVINVAKSIKPSPRGELEITSVNQHYLAQERVMVKTLGRGFAWLDTGTPASMLDASNFIATVETCQGVQVAALEEIAYRKHWINDDQLQALATPLAKNEYGMYLLNLIGKI